MKDWFKARNTWGAAIQTLSDAEAGRLMKALWTYTMTGETVNLTGAEKGIFALILLTLSQDEERDSEISEKRASAGALGGKQRVANQANATFASSKEANQANASNKNKNKNQNKEQDIEKEKEREVKRFAPPTVDEVREYCRERGNNVNPERFIDFYSSKGWRVGNQPMKDWKAAVRTWEQRDNAPAKPQTAPQPQKTVIAQQYEQRSYSQPTRTTAELLDFMARAMT